MGGGKRDPSFLLVRCAGKGKKKKTSSVLFFVWTAFEKEGGGKGKGPEGHCFTIAYSWGRGALGQGGERGKGGGVQRRRFSRCTSSDARGGGGEDVPLSLGFRQGFRRRNGGKATGSEPSQSLSFFEGAVLMSWERRKRSTSFLLRGKGAGGFPI